MFGLGQVGIGGIILFICGAMFKEQLANLWRVVIAHCWRTGKYNLDGKKDTADWCNDFNTAKGEWYLLKIIKIGWFVVMVQDQDNDGDTYDRPIPILKWLGMDTKHVSDRQKANIEEAGNDWPPFGQEQDQLLLLVGAVLELNTRLLPQLGKDIKNVAASVNVACIAMDKETLELPLEPDAELAKSNCDVARSLDRLSATMQHHRKAIVASTDHKVKCNCSTAKPPQQKKK